MSVRCYFASLLVLTGCVEPFSPSAGWDEFEPPGQYRAWHAEVEVCLGMRRSFDDIRWRKVYAETFPCGGTEIATGCIDYPRTIYVVEYLLDYEPLVKAELIHYVRQDGPHDALFTRCGGR